LKLYEALDRYLLKPIGPERAHQLALLGLRSRISFFTRTVIDPYQWRGINFVNRVGIAAGFDKNAVAVNGMAEIGAAFAEVGTVLVRPHGGQPLRPRMARLEAQQGVWNRLGFPSDGLWWVQHRLSFRRRKDLVVGVNMAPHPLTVKTAGEPGFSARVLAELDEIVKALHAYADFFVINLSSPNTAGLRGVMQGEGFADEIVGPIHDRLEELDRGAQKLHRTGLLVKLPPEDAERRRWQPETLAQLIGPLIDLRVCDGFVAGNTSIGLALELAPHALPDAPGGVSGAPLRELALHNMRVLAQLAHPDQLRIGVGGISSGDDALAMVDAGAHLLELYSGMIYRGPQLIGECATALQRVTRAQVTAVEEWGPV
jgi:dihydroorotate dehydrogenase